MDNNGIDRVKEEEPEEDDYLFFSGEEDYDESPDEEVRKSNVMQFGDRLKPPTPVRYSCEALFNMIQKKQIDLEADYQRDTVWGEKKQSAVLDSIYRNFYVPPILFSLQSKINEDGDEEVIRVCVDGKQRLTSIARFMQNKIPMLEPGTNRKFYFKSTPTRSRALTQAKRDIFSQIQMNCVEYTDLTQVVERDMFQRVQLGMPLTGAEKLAGKMGPWPDFFLELCKRFTFQTSIEWLPALDRSKDFLYMGYVCLLILRADEARFVPSNHALNTFLKNNEKTGPREAERKLIISSLARLINLAHDKQHNEPLLPVETSHRKKGQPMAPMEFIFAAFLCYRFPGASNEQLAKLFAGMKERVREEHKDIMINSNNERTIRAYIREQERAHPSWLNDPNPTMNGIRRQRDDDEWEPAMHDSQRRRIGN